MPNKQSAKKRMRQNEKRMVKNRMEKRSVKTHIKNVIAALDSDTSKEDLDKHIALATSKIDKAQKHGVIKKNKASRLKSRLYKRVNKSLQEKQA